MRKIALIIFGAMMIGFTTLRAQEVKPIEASIMKRIIRIFFLISGVLLSACKQNIKEDAADFVFSTENIEGDEAYYNYFTERWFCDSCMCQRTAEREEYEE